MTAAKPFEVLLVEDNPGDVRLTREVMKGGKFLNHLSVVVDGVEAMTFLRKKGKHKNAPSPDLILLDLNLPKKNGREVLKDIKEDPDLKRIPVVVLTISKDEKDILKSYELHANCYITKPVDLKKFTTVIKAIENFFCTIVKLPPNEV